LLYVAVAQTLNHMGAGC